jgi:hypothetical protein
MVSAFNNFIVELILVVCADWSRGRGNSGKRHLRDDQGRRNITARDGDESARSKE